MNACGATFRWVLAATLCFGVDARATEAPALVLTLPQALDKALAKNPTLLSARETEAAVSYRANQALAAYLPQANALVQYSRSTANFVPRPGLDMSKIIGGLLTTLGAPPATVAAASSGTASESMTSMNSYTAQVNVSQLLYDFGRATGTMDAAKSDAQAAVADADAARDAVAMLVNTTFFGVLLTQELQQAAQQTKRQMQQHLELAQAQVQAGARPLIDVTRAKADLANANLAVLRASNGVAIAKSALNAAMGEDEAVASYRVERPAPGAVLEVVGVEEAVRAALAMRPEYRALASRVGSLRELVGVARAGYFPTLNAVGNVTYAGIEVNNLVYNWAAGVNLSWNFFSGFATHNAVDESQARVRAIEASLKSLELAIRNEVETAFLSYKEAQEKMAPTRAALDASQQTLELAEGRYKAGAGSIVEVTDAESLFTSAQAADIAAAFDLEVARARLQKAMGQVAKTSVGASP